MLDNVSSFDIYNSLINLVIALAGIIIAIIQFRIELRKKKEEKIKNQKISNLVNRINFIDSKLVDTYNNEKRIFNSSTSVYEIIDSMLYYSNIRDMISRDYYNNGLLDLYKALLQFESEFSMSYGFGRYIDVLRNTLNELKINESKMTECFEKLVENSDKDIDAFYSSVDHFFQYSDAYVKSRKSLDPFIEEIKYKFENPLINKT